ncbi:hypothetical protein K469DRAFT_695155 [Zopfia rhizophila CBS 207.26]|uniref:C2H2-type domain-containing protein n=1 Tax=Zopfia rhizophila CBS 207.26 TaxID=1314779 RepID=A0A6A6DH76_9PEZI|nr:hypothetical protein K469DRAFT_695155 [Zopfia rhizophila CBS 207.26]
MPPRAPPPNPNAVRLFNCDLCAKSYSRQHEYDNHLSSYDHTHRQRMQVMKKMTADTGRTKSAKRQVDDMQSDSILDPAAKKKSGKGFTKISDLNKQSQGPESQAGDQLKKGFTRIGGPKKEDEVKAEPAQVAPHTHENQENEDEDDEEYDPLYPTECPPDCPGHEFLDPLRSGDYS